MSEARKCDRCHGFYEVNPFDRNYMTIGARTIIGTNGKGYDLCPNCVELLDKWLENHKEETKLSDPYEDGGL